MEQGTPIRVLLADDHPLVRQGIRRALERATDIVVVGEAADGRQALDLVRELQPDIILCDVRLPVSNGIEIVRRAKERSPASRTVLLSAFDDDQFIFDAIAGGAAGYLLKTMDANELPDAVRRASAGQLVLHPSVSAKLAQMLGGGPYPATPKLLTAREQEVLVLAARGLKNSAIAKALNLSTRTVEGHFARIFNKLSVSSREQAVSVSISRHLIDASKVDERHEAS